MGGKKGVEPSGFAERLKALREASGLSQGELAEKAGMNLWGIAKIEQGHREPSWQTVLVLAEALGVGVEAFAVTKKKAKK
jgi:transcriptional regulator with XRE-family HTH domain